MYHSLGKYNQTKHLNEKAATSYSKMASVYYSLGEYNQAKELHEKALIISKKIFGKHHANVATSYNNLASV